MSGIKCLKTMTIHKSADNMYNLVKRGYAILDDQNLYIKLKKQEEHNIRVNTDIKNIIVISKK